MLVILIMGLLATLLVSTPRAQAATFDLSTCNPDPQVNGSLLIAAIATANSNVADDTIQLGACTYELANVDNTVDGANGLPSILPDGGDTVTIEGALSGPSFIERATTTKDAFRIFHIAAGATVAIRNVTIRNGLARGTDGMSGETATDGGDGMGGAIYNAGALTLYLVTLDDNQAIGGAGGTSFGANASGMAGRGRGGAIFNTATGSLDLDAVILQTNSTTGGRGGDRTNVPTNFSFGKQGGVGQGGAIYTLGPLTMNGGALNDNQAIGGQSGNISGEAPNLYGTDGGNGYGGAIYVEGGSAQLSNVGMQNNTIVGGAGGVGTSGTSSAGSGYGGALFSGAPLAVSGGTIADNSVPNSNGGGGGAITIADGPATIDGTSFQGNGAPGGSGGGAVLVLNSTVTVTNSLFLNNSASTGGAVATDTESGSIVIQIQDSRFISNTAEFDGGALALYKDVFTISGSTFADNLSAGVEGGGGAIRTSGNLRMSNSTLSGNRTSGTGGGLFSDDRFVTLDHVTISANVADSEGIGDNNGGGGIATTNVVSLTNTIVAGNFDMPSSSGEGTIAPDVSGAIRSFGYNLIGDGTGSIGLVNGTRGDQVGSAESRLDPLLGVLANNGGPTPTRALLAGSPAIDMGDPEFASPPAYDQRGVGFNRIDNGRTDIGAFEVQILTPGIELTPNPLDFGNQQINTTSTTQLVTLRSTGTAALQVNSITVSGDFAIVANTAEGMCPASPPPFTLEPQLSCTIGISFTPTATGARTGALAVASNASGSPHSVALSGVGTSTPTQTTWKQFLPIARMGGQADLTITSLSISPSKESYIAGETVQISVTVTNQGNAPTTNPFWVDLYINPARPPTINTLWSDVCGITPCVGVTWPVLTTLAPGQSITLTTTRTTYDLDRSFWLNWLPSGTTDIYALADSWNTSGTSGAVSEANESNNLAQIEGLTVTGTNPPYEPWPGLTRPQAATPGGLPARPVLVNR